MYVCTYECPLENMLWGCPLGGVLWEVISEGVTSGGGVLWAASCASEDSNTSNDNKGVSCVLVCPPARVNW